MCEYIYSYLSPLSSAALASTSVISAHIFSFVEHRQYIIKV